MDDWHGHILVSVKQQNRGVNQCLSMIVRRPLPSHCVVISCCPNERWHEVGFERVISLQQFSKIYHRIFRNNGCNQRCTRNCSVERSESPCASAHQNRSRRQVTMRSLQMSNHSDCVVAVVFTPMTIERHHELTPMTSGAAVINDCNVESTRQPICELRSECHLPLIVWSTMNPTDNGTI